MGQGEREGPRVGGAGAVHELSRAKETSARGKVGKGRRTREGEQRREGGIYGRGESGEARARTTCPIGGR
jgi:hypothetical protein